ncbi:hypothetical protein [Streptomyces sp. NPDC020681]|uniref:hypothetical protein n=1 Tax=Streptomyces sp. NPDC020681 TaxID=3365083 RepID=UPI0037AC9F0F
MRILVGALGAASLGYGAWLLYDGGQYADVAIWLAGAVVLHDGIIAPLVLAVGLLLAFMPARGTLRAALIVAGSLTVIALPLLLRPGAKANSSVLPLDYGRNLLIAIGAVAVLTAALLVMRRLRSFVADRRSAGRS